MVLGAKERKEVVSITLERLSAVIGASGKAEELVRLTTQIVQATKKLVEGTPELTKTRSTATLAEFVVAAKRIAQDARAVDSSSLQQLSATRRAVEFLVRELDGWHESQMPKNDRDLSLDDILSQTTQMSRQDSRSSTGSRGKGSPPHTPTSELEKKLVAELKRQQEGLLKKTDPQSNPEQHGQPDDVLKMAVSGLSRSIKELTELSSQKSPTKESLVEPTILLAKMVSVLMDLVDSLFVSKFPMRTQVHSFCCMLVENAIAYNAQSKTEDAATLRLISTQAPALMSALEVMVEQCYARSQNIRESQQMSIQRKVDLKKMESGVSPRVSPAVKRRKELPTPPTKAKAKAAAPPPIEFEIYCMICTGVAVDSQTNHMMAKGSEITLKVDASKTVYDVRKILSKRTGLPLDHIQLRFQGDNDLSDHTKVMKDNPVPYFMFNLHEPGEEELQEIRKEQRRKNRQRIDDADWSRVTSPVAVAIYDYEALAEPGEDDNLEFDEGDLIEVMEKSADGWWTGRIDGKVGVFPASFVEQIDVPKTKDEAKKLVKKFRQGKLGIENHPETKGDAVSLPEEFDEAAVTRPASLHTQSSHQPTSSSQRQQGGPFRRIHSHTGIQESASAAPYSSGKRSQSVRKAGEFENEKKDKKGGSKRLSHLFKKKHHSYQPITEEKDPEPSRASLPPLSNRRGTPTIDEEPSGMVVPEKSAMLPPARPLFRPASSPRLTVRSTTEGSKPSSPSALAPGGPKRRPARPPPPPPPYARTHGPMALSDLLKKQPSEEGDTEPSSGSGGVSPVPPREDSVSPAPLTMQRVSPPTSVSPAGDEVVEEEQEEEEEDEDLSPVKSSKSMEELFKNLEEFDEFSSGTPPLTNGIHSKEKGERDFGTIPRDELPIKVEDYDKLESEEMDEPESRGSTTPASTPDICVPEPSLESQPSLSQNSDESKQPSSVLSQPPAKPPRARKKRPVAQESQPAPPVAASKPRPPPKPSAEVVTKGEGEKRESASPQPKAPPRRKSKKMSERMSQFEKKDKEQLMAKELTKRNTSGVPRPGKFSPTPPAKPKSSKHLAALERSVCSSAPGSRTGSPDIKKNGLSGLVRESSSSTDQLESSSNPSRSPVVMRRTRAVVKGDEPQHSDDELEEWRGVGKEGMLHKEGTQSAKWKARYFRVLDDRVIYYDNGSHSEDTKPLGEILASKMQGAVVLGEKSNFYCFAINMRYDTSVVLGCKSSEDAEDWARSINKMMKTAKSEVRAKTYGPSYKTAVKCISYLSEDDRTTEDKLFTSVTGDSRKINKWLESVDRGEDPDLSGMPNAATAVSLLKALFRNGRLGCLVEHELAEELCDLTKSASPLDVLCTKLEQISGDYRGLLKQLLRLFSQVLQHSDSNHTNVEDLNRTFGPLLFEKVAVAQSEPLLAYLISTCELVLS